MLAAATRSSASSFARRFIAGTNTEEVVAAARLERQQGRGFTLDVLGEAVTSELEAADYFRAYLELLNNVAPQVNAWPERPLLDEGVTGPLPRMNLSIKLTALDSQFDAIDPAGTTRRVAPRLRELLRVARDHQAFINIDMESYAKKDLTLHVFKTVLEEEEFRDVGDVGIVIQAYLRDSGSDLRELRDWAQRRGKPVWVRLVKGAYWDYETVHAAANGWPVPVYQQKVGVRCQFRSATDALPVSPITSTCGLPWLRTILRSLAHGIAVAEHLEMPPHAFEIQMLYGMADAEKQALVDLARNAPANLHALRRAHPRHGLPGTSACWKTPPTTRSCGPVSKEHVEQESAPGRSPTAACASTGEKPDCDSRSPSQRSHPS